MDKEFQQQKTDAEFLTQKFGIGPHKASEMVARNGVAAEDIAEELQGPDGDPIERDPLKDVPTPSGPEKEFVADTDEQDRKPVLHRRNDRQGP